MKKREIGEPTIVEHTLADTSEHIADNREKLRSVCESAVSEIAGRPVSLKINWGDNQRKQ